MSQLGQAVRFATSLYRQRAEFALAGYVQRDPMALLTLRPGRVNPYAIYEQLRAVGTLAPTRLGNWVSTSHRVCNTVLRDRRFAVAPARPQTVDEDEFNMSFLQM